MWIPTFTFWKTCKLLNNPIRIRCEVERVNSPYDFLMTGTSGRLGMKALPNGSLLLSILSPFWMSSLIIPKLTTIGDGLNASWNRKILNLWVPLTVSNWKRQMAKCAWPIVSTVPVSLNLQSTFPTPKLPNSLTGFFTADPLLYLRRSLWLCRSNPY